MNSSNEHIGLHINIASLLIRRRLDSFTMPMGLSGIQIRILRHLEVASQNESPVYQRDIEKQFGIRRSSVTSVISNLEQNGYVRRLTVPGDARLKQLVLTEAGENIICLMAQNVDTLEKSLADLFSPEQKETLIGMLHKIIHALEEPKNEENK